MTDLGWQKLDPRLVAVAASLLVSVYTILLPGLPNDDAYVYVRTAEIYLNQGMAAAFEHYGWAGYSIIIAELSRLGLSLFTAGYILNAVLFALLVYAFVSIVMMMYERREITILAALTVLLYPELNEFRYLIIRDVGFWAFALTGIWQLLVYGRQRSSASALGFTLSFLLATLFRAEAILYLVLLPLSLLVDTRLEKPIRKALFVRLTQIAYGALATLLIILLLAGVNPLQLLADFFSVYLPFLQSTFNPSPERTAELGRLLFGDFAAAFSQDYMNGVIAAGLLVILFMTIFYGISGAYFWMLAFGYYKRFLSFKQLGPSPVTFTIAINLLILLVFLYVTRYLSTRYAMLLCLMIATQLPLVVTGILDHYKNRGFERLSAGIVIIFFVFCAFDAYISFGRPKDYLLDSATFVANETVATGELLTNNRTIAYFSDRVEDYDQIMQPLTITDIESAQPGDLIALEMNAETSQLIADEDVQSLLQFVTAFPSESQQQVTIYRRIRN